MRVELRYGLIAAAVLAVLAIIDIVLISKQSMPDTEDQYFTVHQVPFSALPGWRRDALSEALPVFARSCAPILNRAADQPRNPREAVMTANGPVSLAGQVADWSPACTGVTALINTGPPDDAAARAFFETHFIPLRLTGPVPSNGLFTGYFETLYDARRQPEGAYDTPVLTVPEDIISVDLGDFAEDLSGRQILGRIDGSQLIPYADHEEIIASPPPGSNVLAWMEPNDLLFMQIQGSGRLRLKDGTILRAGYAGKNGRAYVPVGRTLVQDGHLVLEEVSMQSIRAWLANAPGEDAARIRYSNPSYVFFRHLDDLADPALGPLGAQGVQLTPERSLAIDPRYYAYGAPIWLHTVGSEDNPALSRLFIAQDTGGAIRGAQRGDVYFGSGPAAGALAGTMKAEGELFVLVPKPVWERQSHAAP